MNPSRRFNIASRRQSNNSPDINKPRHQTDSWPTHRSRISLGSKLLTLFFNINLDAADPRRRTSRGIRPQQIWAVDLGQRWYHLHKWWVTHGYFISRSQKLTAAPPFVERTTGSVRIGGVSVLPCCLCPRHGSVFWKCLGPDVSIRFEDIFLLKPQTSLQNLKNSNLLWEKKK